MSNIKNTTVHVSLKAKDISNFFKELKSMGFVTMLQVNRYLLTQRGLNVGNSNGNNRDYNDNSVS